MIVKPVICFETLYKRLRAEEKTEKIADFGFGYVEFRRWRDKDLITVGRTYSRRGVKVANFSGQRIADPINPMTRPKLIDDYRDVQRAAAMLRTDILMVLTQELGEGGSCRERVSRSERRCEVVELSKWPETISGMHRMANARLRILRDLYH